ncbi:MAG: PDZ domain-containing protein [Akkermansiaceae bacterium]
MKFLTPLFLVSLALPLFTSCNEKSLAQSNTAQANTAQTSANSALQISSTEIEKSVVRVSSTLQGWSPSQPWDKTPSSKRNALGALINSNQVLTTADMAANATYIEFQNADKTISIPAKVVAIDYEVNLALLEADASLSSNAETFFKGMQPLTISEPANIGEAIEIWQLDTNGMPIVTPTFIQSVDILASFSAGHYFLTYLAKGSMQSASNSFTLPAIHNGQLIGLLTAYNTKDQIIDIMAPEVITAFLADAEDSQYTGFPSLGVGIDNTVDPNFRQWLKLPDDMGGIYITKIAQSSAAEKAGLLKGDVIIKINEHEIDRRGYYSDENYGKLYWSHLIRGLGKVDQSIDITVLRDAEEKQLTAELQRAPENLVPSLTYDQEPRYLLKGGFIFQELTETYLKAFGNEWQSKAPLSLLNVLSTPEEFETDRNRVVLLTATIPTPATTGYESLNNLIISKVNGQVIADIPSLIQAFQTPHSDGLHTIEFEDGNPKTIYLDATIANVIDAELLKRGIPALSRP